MTRGSTVSGLLVSTLLLAACGAATTTQSTTGASPTSSASTRTTTPAATPTPWQTLSGGSTGSARITDMQVSTGSVDTLTVQFDAPVPHYEVSLNPSGAQFTGTGGKGGTYTLSGTDGVTLRISNLLWTQPPGNQFAHGTDLKQPNGMLVEAREIADSEGVVVIAMGLAHAMSPTATILTNPARLVITYSMG